MPDWPPQCHKVGPTVRLGEEHNPGEGPIISAIRPYALARRALPIIGCVLALVAPLLIARAQAPQAGGGLKVRVLYVSTPPLADEQLPEGGLVPALVNASLARAKGGAGPKPEVRWTSGGLSQEVLSDQTVDLFLPAESADCDRPSALTHASAVVCDHALYSEPILQVVLGLFSLAESTFKFDTDDSVLGRTVCVWREDDLAALNANGRNWAAYKRITVLRRTTLLDCIVAVQAHDADAFAAIDLQGAHLLRKLGLAPYISMHPRPLATRGVHAVVWRDNPRAAELLATLNEGLRQLKQGNAYASLVQQQLMAAEAPPVKVASAKAPAPAPKAPVSPPAPKATTPSEPPKATAAATAPPTRQEPTKELPPAVVKEATAPPQIAALSTPPSEAKAAPKPPPPAPVPVLDPASRAIALKFLKRGDQELSEGRVAPARLLFERAAEMGLAQAAMALGATFDAAELAKPHLRNIPADPDEAKRWYERAKVLGAADAPARLQRLGSTAK